jgi:hypothetical protein
MVTNGEAIREVICNWIRTNAAPDAIVHFEAFAWDIAFPTSSKCAVPELLCIGQQLIAPLACTTHDCREVIFP